MATKTKNDIVRDVTKEVNLKTSAHFRQYSLSEMELIVNAVIDVNRQYILGGHKVAIQGLYNISFDVRESKVIKDNFHKDKDYLHIQPAKIIRITPSVNLQAEVNEKHRADLMKNGEFTEE